MPTPNFSARASHPGSGAALRIRIPGTDRASIVTDSALLGRAAGCDLELDDHRISPRHAELYRVGSLWWVRDLGSRDGTYLDDEVIEAAPVSRRATLRLGADGPVLALEPEAVGVAV